MDELASRRAGLPEIFFRGGCARRDELASRRAGTHPRFFFAADAPAAIKRKGERLGGVVTADATLAALSKLFNWHAARTDDFVSPVVKGMRRAKPPKERARQRVLSDLELRLMWPILRDGHLRRGGEMHAADRPARP